MYMIWLLRPTALLFKRFALQTVVSRLRHILRSGLKVRQREINYHIAMPLLGNMLLNLDVSDPQNVFHGSSNIITGNNTKKSLFVGRRAHRFEGIGSAL